MSSAIFGPFTLVVYGEAPKPPVTTFDDLEAAKSAVAALEIPSDARILIMGNRRTPFGSIRCPVA